MPSRLDAEYRKILADLQGRQLRLGGLGLSIALFVAPFLVGIQESAEGDHGAADGELGIRALEAAVDNA